MSAAAQALLLAPEDDGNIPAPLRKRVEESLSARDRAFLQQLRSAQRIEVGSGQEPGELEVLWLLHFGLVEVDVDPKDRVFLVATPVLTVYLEPPTTKRRRRRRKATANARQAR